MGRMLPEAVRYNVDIWEDSVQTDVMLFCSIGFSESYSSVMNSEGDLKFHNREHW